MTAQQIKDIIMSFLNDVMLDYPDHDMIFINPFNENKFELSYDDISKTYDNIDDLMSDRIFDGKTLTEIAPQLTAL